MSVINQARRYIGSPYLFGGNGTEPGQKMDCSKFVQNVMRNMGIKYQDQLPHKEMKANL
jgi:cell wall-associated NlpC family hydrolase